MRMSMRTHVLGGLVQLAVQLQRELQLPVETQYRPLRCELTNNKWPPLHTHSLTLLRPLSEALVC